MNYLQEINAFNDWLLTNPSVSSDDIVLWYALMNLNNMCGWKKEFTVAISTIVDRSRLSRSAIYRSRNRLVQFGRIRTKERSGNQCSTYQMVSFASHPGTQDEFVSPYGTQPGTQVGTQTGTQPGTITKLKETKLNTKEFKEQWERWKKFRKEKKKPLTQTTESSQLKFLGEQDNPGEVLEQSIRNGWVGLFPLKASVIPMHEKRLVSNYDPTDPKHQW